MPFPQSFLDELMARSDIVDVVGSYVQLTRKGANLFGLCPFPSVTLLEASKGTLRPIGNRSESVMAQGCLTERPTSRSGRKLEHSDPVVPHGRAIAQRIKGTPGITG